MTRKNFLTFSGDRTPNPDEIAAIDFAFSIRESTKKMSDSDIKSMTPQIKKLSIIIQTGLEGTDPGAQKSRRKMICIFLEKLVLSLE